VKRLYRLLLQIVPGSHSDWIRAHEAELAHIRGRWQRCRWIIGLLPLTGAALVRQLRHDAGSFLGGFLMKVIVVSLSLLNLVAGVGVLVLQTIEPSPHRMALAIGGVLLVQSGFTLALATGVFGSRQPTATRMQRAGSALAVTVGSVAFLVGFIANVSPANPDPEFAPMTLALLVAAHGMASLLAFGRPEGDSTGSARS
jgi:hypothetical protein